jgi:hypothetical protein
MLRMYDAKRFRSYGLEVSGEDVSTDRTRVGPEAAIRFGQGRVDVLVLIAQRRESNSRLRR